MRPMADLDPRRRRAIGLAIGIPIAIALVAWALTYSPLFHARHIRVQGNRTLSAKEVTALAAVGSSTNVVHLDEAPIVARLTSDPWIAGASVHADLPGTLVISVEERAPIGVISALGDTALLASDGTELPFSKALADGLPTVRAGIGMPDDAQRAAAAAMLSALDPVVSRRVAGVIVGQDGIMTLTLTSGATVDAGVAGEEPAKAAALRGVLRWASSKGLDLRSIDISAPAAPSATLADGSTFTP